MATNNTPGIHTEGILTSETVETTHIVTDGDIVQNSINFPRDIISIYSKSSQMNSEDTVKSFLGRPNGLIAGSFSASDVVSTFAGVYLPKAMIEATPIVAKLQGYYGMRATIVLRLQVNANKFQQGRYMLTWCPTGGVNPASAKGSDWILAHSNTLVQRSQLHHVEIDLACDTQAILKIPFVSAFNCWPTRDYLTADLNTGVARIYPYSPLVAVAGSTVASYHLYAHFEDIELIGPAVPQSGMSNIEQNKAKVGPVTGTLMKMSDSLNILGTVPFLSSYAKPTAAFSEVLSRAANIFGWSKPASLPAQIRVNRTPILYGGNVDGFSSANPLSLSIKNGVDILPGFSGTDIDELDFANFATIPSWLRTVSWTTSDIIITELTSINVSPINFQLRTGLGAKGFYDMSPMNFVASHFSYWRGSITYKFKLVKTEFHSGRLAVAFYPYFNNTPGTMSLITSYYVNREFIDIREHNEFTITVPYISATPYMSTDNSIDNRIGQLKIFVLDALIAPATVSSSVSIIIEQCAGPDFEVASKRTPNWMPVMLATPESGLPNVCSLLDKNIGSSQPSFDNYMNSSAVMGERISSFRSLLKVNHMFFPSAPLSGADKWLSISPFVSGVYYNSVTPGVTSTADLYCSLSSIFLLSRGGVRITVIPGSEGDTPFAAMVSDLNAVTSQFLCLTTRVDGSQNYDDMLGQPLSWGNITAEKGMELQIPQYQPTHSRSNVAYMVNTNAPTISSFIGGGPRQRLVISFPTASGLEPTALRAGADDLNFGCFVSIPPMTYSLITT